VDFIRADIRDAASVRKAIEQCPHLDAVIHLASQVAVTTSVQDPREDFEVNALGTFNLLEAVRLCKRDAAFLFASTNKVYGGLDGVAVVERDGRYTYRDLPRGISEDHSIDFHSPYGCSKGAADQYVRDYARIYGLKTAVLRQSCIYGPWQYGMEDQGWVAWFTIAAVLGRPLVIYGDGKQVRDVLYIEDLVEAYRLAIERIDQVSGKIYNLGGGPENVLSLLELIAMLEGLTGRRIPRSSQDWRPGDQPVFICDIDRARRELNWRPQVNPEEGVRRLYHWVVENQDILRSVLS
jgi:CDP-paratose 2-epimerase